MKFFFYPLLSELRQIFHEGGIAVERNGSCYRFLPLITQCNADLPAKADLQGMTNHNGYMGCGYCLHPGYLVKAPNGNKAVVRFVRNEFVPIRTHHNFWETYRSLTSSSNRENGIKNVSCMTAAIGFDLANSYSIDYLHCVLLGVMRKLLSLWFDSKYHDQPYYISKKKQDAFNKRLIAIKPTTEITRKPRSIFDRADFKGNELRSILLYYLRFCLDGLLPIRYINHVQLLSSAIYMLLQESISITTVDLAESRLKQFSDQFEELYGKHNITMNIHLLRHMGDAVKQLGPLWTQSTFAYETNNGVIVRAKQAKRDFIQQIAWKYSVKPNLEPTERCKAADPVVSLSVKTKIKITQNEICILNDRGFNFSDAFLTFSSIMLRGIKYTSKSSKSVSTIDYFARFRGGQIGAIKFYFIDNCDVYAFVLIYNIIGLVDHLMVIQCTDQINVFNIDEVEQKLIYMAIAKQEIVTTIPNRFEKT